MAVTGKGRGFKSMTPEKKRETASKGGKKAHELGKAHKFTSEEAQKAGAKGGKSSKRSRVRGSAAFDIVTLKSV